MPNTPSQLHTPRPIEDVVLAYRPDLQGYLATRLFPHKSVKHRTDDIRRENKGNLLRLRDVKVGPDGRLSQVEMRFDKHLRYSAQSFGVEVELLNEERADADSEVQYDSRKTTHGMVTIHTYCDYVAIKQTARVATNYGTQNVDLAGTPDQWSNKLNLRSQPIQLCLYIAGEIENHTGHRPNFWGMHSRTWDTFVDHPNVRALAAREGGQGAVYTIEMFEKALRLQPGTVQLTSANYNVSDDEDTEDFRSFIGPDMIVCYNEDPKIDTYGFCQGLWWNGVNTAQTGLRDYSMPGEDDGLPRGDIAVRAYDAPWLGTDGGQVVKITGKVDWKIMTPKAGFLVKNVVDGTDANKYGNFLNN